MSTVLARVNSATVLVRCVCGREYNVKNKSTASILRQVSCRRCCVRVGRPARRSDFCQQCGDYRHAHGPGRIYEHPFVDSHASLMLYDAWARRTMTGWTTNVIRVCLGLEPLPKNGKRREEAKALRQKEEARYLLEEKNSPEEASAAE